MRMLRFQVALLSLFAASLPGAADDLAFLKKMDPAERLAKMAKVLVKEQDFAPLTRGPMTIKVTRTGTVEADTNSVYCRVDSRPDASFATTILWLVDEDTFVKKGDRLAILDCTYLHGLLERHKKTVVRATEFARLSKLNDALAQRGQERGVRQAEFDLDAVLGHPCQARGSEAFNAAPAAAALDLARLCADLRMDHVYSYQQRTQAALDRAIARQRYLEGQIAQCVIRAPRDGLVLFPLAQQQFGKGKGRAGQVKVKLAPGDKVSEGQRLLRICDLKKLTFSVAVSDAQIDHIRRGARAQILFEQDSFPKRNIPAVVKTISSYGSGRTGGGFRGGDSGQHWVYLELQGDLAGLKPDMKGTVAITLDNCLRLPARSLVSMNGDVRCFVLNGNDLEERIVDTGLADGDMVQVRGLKEGDMVLSDPRAAVVRMLQREQPEED